MKKLILPVALFAATTAFAQFEEGFESYEVGDFICVETDLFDVWPGGDAPGSAWDSQVTDEFASEGDKSLKIEAQSVTGGPMDVLLNVMKSEGNWSLDFDMMVPDGNSAYFNVQGTDVAGAGTGSWQCNFFVDAAGNAVADGPWGMSDLTTVPIDAFFNVRFVVDLDQGLFKMWIDGTELFQAPYDGNFSSINFYALGDGQTIGLYYVDNITLAESDVDLVGVEDLAVASFAFSPNPSSGQLNISGILEAQELVVLDLMGREVARIAVDVAQQNVALDIPEGVYLFGPADRQQLRKLVIRR